jgi:PAT family beta-lactamase induction signal transducer AmpG
MSASTSATPSIWQTLLQPRMLTCALMGFASGLPLYVLIQLLPLWLRSEGIDLASIGLFALIGFPYTWKFLWSPLVDRYQLPFLSKRRGWMLASQISLLMAIVALGSFDPKQSLLPIVMLSIWIAFSSATQDIVLDALRRELLADQELGIGNAIFVNTYRISSLVPASLAPILADHLPWSWVFSAVGGFMVIGILLTLKIREPQAAITAPLSLQQTFIEPFKDFLQRFGGKQALLICSFMLLYKLGDSMATALSTPFYLDMGFTKTQIGVVAKHAALWPAVIGGLLGGLLMIRIGINRGLWIFGVIQTVSILGFYWLSISEANLWQLACVIAFEYLGVGLGTAAFTAFIARVSSKTFAATQLALLTALTAVPRTFLNASAGYLIEWLSYPTFFLLCTALAIPGMLLLFKIAPWNNTEAS